MQKVSKDSSVVYLTSDFEVTTKDKADLIKIIYPEGSVAFVTPTK